MDEEAVLAAIGEPTSKQPMHSPGQFKKPPVGQRCAYLLQEGEGVVWIDLDMDKNVTGIFWRKRD